MPQFLDSLTVEQLATSNSVRWVPSVQATASGTLSLTASSASLQLFTGTVAGQTVQLPNATTLNLGNAYWIFNTSSAAVTLNDGGGNALAILTNGENAICFLEANGSAAGTWAISTGSNVSQSIAYLTASSLTQFTAAVSALNALNGGEVRITGPIVLTSNLTINMSNVTIEGDIGSASPLNLNGHTLTIAGSGAVFRHVRFLGTNGSAGSVSNTIINLDPVTTPIWMFFEGCMFKNIYGSIPWSITYGFTIPASSVTAGAIYTTNNGVSTYTYTVSTTISGGTTLTTTGNGTPPATGTLIKVSGTGPATIAYTAAATPVGSGAVFDFRNATTNSLEVTFSDCDMDANWVPYPTGFGTGLTFWFSQTAGFDYHIKVLSCLESIQGRDRFSIMPPSGIAVANNQIFFETDGTGRHYGPLPGAGNASQQIELLPLDKVDGRSMLVDVPSGGTMSLEPNFSGLYLVGEGLVRITATASAQTVTLPLNPYAGSGFALYFYKVGTFDATLTANTGQTVNGGSAYVIKGGDKFLRLFYDTANLNWIVWDGVGEGVQGVQVLTGTTVLANNANNIIVNAASAATITLPSAAGILIAINGIYYAQPLSITNIGSYPVTIAAAGSDTVVGSSSVVLPYKNSSYTLIPYYTGSVYGWSIN